MKFVVTKDYNNEVEVKLHWESKDKIRRNLYWGFLTVACSAAAYVYIVNNPKKTPSE